MTTNLIKIQQHLVRLWVSQQFQSTYLTQRREAWEATAPVVRIIEQTRKWSTKLFNVVLSIKKKKTILNFPPSLQSKVDTDRLQRRNLWRNGFNLHKTSIFSHRLKTADYPRVRTNGCSRRRRETDLHGHEGQLIYLERKDIGFTLRRKYRQRTQLYRKEHCLKQRVKKVDLPWQEGEWISWFHQKKKRMDLTFANGPRVFPERMNSEFNLRVKTADLPWQGNYCKNNDKGSLHVREYDTHLSSYLWKMRWISLRSGGSSSFFPCC